MLRARQAKEENLYRTLATTMERAGRMIAYDPELELDKRNAWTMAISVILTCSDWSPIIDTTGLFEWKMAISTQYNNNQKRPIVSYPPEPVLAMAALRTLQKFPSDILNDLIR